MLRWLSAFVLAATLSTGGSAGGARGETCWGNCPPLVRAQADGSGRHDLTPPPGDSVFIGLSSDTTRMLYDADGAAGGLYSQRVDGTDVRRLFADPTGIGRPSLLYPYESSLSPDGRRVALVRVSTDGGCMVAALWTASAVDGSDLREISPCMAAPARWSPDSKRLAFVRATEGFSFDMELEIENADGTGERRISPIHDDTFAFDWSPRGDRIAYTVGKFLPTAQLHVVRTDGSGDRVIARAGGPLWDQGPAFVWAPDGRELVLSYGRYHRLAVIGADGRGLRLVDVRGAARSPAWAPNGNLSFVTGDRSIWTERADGSGRRLLVKRPVHTSVGRLWSAPNGSLAYDTWRWKDSPFIPTLWIRRPNGTTRGYTATRRGVASVKNALVVGNVWWAPDSRSLIYAIAVD